MMFLFIIIILLLKLTYINQNIGKSGIQSVFISVNVHQKILIYLITKMFWNLIGKIDW